MNGFLQNKFVLLILLLAITFLITLYLWQSWKVIDLRQRKEELEEELVPLVEKNRSLQIEVIRTFSLERLEKLALEKLGMERPFPKEETN